MPIVAVLAASAAALIHLWFFALESGLAIVLFACACMVGAGIVLLATNRRFLAAGALQAGPPSVALIAAFVL